MSGAGFLSAQRPLIVAMIEEPTAEACIKKVRLSEKAGAEAYGFLLHRIEPSDRTEEKLKEIFAACNGKPIYVTTYPKSHNKTFTDEMCMEQLFLARRCGATLCDIPGDTFDRNSLQITEDPVAVKKQLAVAEKIHKMGGEVLISSHTNRSLGAEEIFRIARLQSEHGADIIKIVVESEDPALLTDYIAVIQRVKRELGKKILLLDGGACRQVMRKLGGVLGSAMYLAVLRRDKNPDSARPTIHCCRTILKQLEML